MYNNNSILILVNVTIANNIIGYIRGSNIHNENNSSLTIQNSIIYGDINCVYNKNSNIVDIKNSLVQGVTLNTGTNIDGNTPPLFVSAPSGNYWLRSSSPCRDKGNNGYIPVGITNDLAGNPRKFGDTVDMGAYEYTKITVVPDANGVVYVNQTVATGNGNGSSWYNAAIELADALYDAKNNSAIQQIWVAKGTYKPLYKAAETDINGIPTTDRHCAFVLVSGVCIYGGFTGAVTETTLNQRNWDNNPTILSGDIGVVNNNSDNVYHVVISAGYMAVQTYLDGITITGGNANALGNYMYVNGYLVESFHGGGVYNISSSQRFTNSNIIGNTAYSGGGMWNNNSQPIFENGSIANNTASSEGGGMFNLQNSMVILHIGTIENNTAVYGGGIVNINHSTSYLEDFIVRGNAASAQGGGVYTYSVSSEEDISACILRTVLLVNNTAGMQGPALYNYSSYCSMTNVTCTENTSSNNRALVYNSNSVVKIQNSIIWGNYTYGTVSTPTLPLYANSLVKGETANDANGNIAGNTNPLFIDPNNGNYRLQYTSPCMDAGTDTFNLLCCDLDLNPRIMGSRIDMGAYEYQKLPVVPNSFGIVHVNQQITTGNGSGDSWNNAVHSLSEALRTAKINTAIQQIWVAHGTYYPEDKAAVTDVNNNPTTDRHKSFVLLPNVKMYGGFTGATTETTLNHRNWEVNPTILSGDIGVQGNSSDNVYHVIISSGNSGSGCLDGFTITGGNGNEASKNIYVNGNLINGSRGGGIYNYGHSSNSTYKNLKIMENTASSGGGIWNEVSSCMLENIYIENNNASSSGQGGGMFNYYSDIQIQKGSISNNTAPVGAGVSNSYNSKIGLTNVLIKGNTASTYGGGIYNSYDNGTRTACNLNNVAIINNTASAQGGALYNEYNTCTLTNVTCTGNVTVINNRAPIYNINATVNIYNSIIWGNNSLYGISSGSPVYFYSLVEGVTTSGINGNLAGNTNPLFMDPNNGNYRLAISPLSPCIGAGNNSYNTVTTTDLDGNPRIQGPHIDLGTYESSNITLIAPPSPPIADNNTLKNKSDNNEEILTAETKPQLTLLVYPNPLQNGYTSTLVLEENALPYTANLMIRLYSLSGQLLYSKMFPSGYCELDLPWLTSGMYVITAQTEAGKLYKQKIAVNP
jgi:hypothetical protein